MFSGVRRLLSASYLFSVCVDGILGCCALLLAMDGVFACGVLPFIVWFVVVGWKIPAFDRLADWIHFLIFNFSIMRT